MSITIKNASGEIIKSIPAEANRTILKQLEAEGVSIAAACYTGICGACICEIEEGEENIDKEAITAAGFPLADEEVMTCIAKIKNVDENIILKSMY